MDDDYSIVEKELTEQLSVLKRDLHMKKVKTLGRKLHGLRKMALQRKLIGIMSIQVEELEPTVSKIYSPQNALKDNQIKGYLVYLLQLKDFFSRDVDTKKEILKQREDQITKLTVKLCTMRNEYSKKKRSLRAKASEFIQLENISNKINQLEQRIGSLKNEIKGQRESIMDMRVFEKQHKKFENKFRSQLTRMTEDVQLHLDRAVATYEEREGFVHKAKIYKERCAQDLRKAALNENALQLVLDKSEKLEDFGSVQNQTRYDSRIATTGDLIDQGITGLEPDLKTNQDLYSSIVRSSGKEGAELMEDHFKLTDDKTESMFSYLKQLLKEIHHTQESIDELKEEKKGMLKSMVAGEKKIKWKIEEDQKKAEECRLEATASDENLQSAREQLHFLLEKVQSLGCKCFPREETKDAKEPEDAAGSDAGTAEKKKKATEKTERWIDDLNAIDYTENIEKEILKLLMVIEYLRVKELSEEDVSTSILEEDGEEELPEIDEPPKVDYLDTVQPRVLQSKIDLDALSDLDQENVFLDLDELKERAVLAVHEMESERSGENGD